MLDVGGPDDTVRLLSVHPGVTVEEVQAETGFDLAVAGEVPETGLPTMEELVMIREASTQGLYASRRRPE